MEDVEEHEHLKVGRTFEDWEELKKEIIDEGVKTERVLVTHKKDPYKWKLRCRMNDASKKDRRCPWTLCATKKSQTEAITIARTNLVHTCEAADHYGRRMHTNSSRLADQIMELIVKNRQTKPSFLRDTTQAMLHPDVQYHTAWKAKQVCLKRRDGDQTESFKLIPAHCRHIEERDPGAVAKFRAPNGSLDFLFVCPSSSAKSYKHCRPMVAFDGTHTRCMYPGILLLATTLDGNNTFLVLAYAWVPAENTTNWELFMKLLHEAMPDLGKADTVFISDRDKGLKDVVPTVYPTAHLAYCTWHMSQNVKKHHGKEMSKLFDRLPYATTPAKFAAQLERINLKNKDAAKYIKDTADPKYYSRAFFPAKRWGHETSQQAESMYRMFKPQRMEVTLNMSLQLWDYLMVKYFEKAEVASTLATPFPSNIMKHLRDVELDAHSLTAHPSSQSEVWITDDMNHQHVVRLSPNWSCTCGDFQDTLLPCKHAWRAITRLHLRHFDFVSDFYSTETLRKTYAYPLPALVRTDLDVSEHCGPPLKKRRAGRPSERVNMRFPDEEVCRLPRKCSLCGGQGHNKTKCPTRIAAGEEREENSNSHGALDNESSAHSSDEGNGGHTTIVGL